MTQDLIDTIRGAIEDAIPGARAEVALGAGAGHYSVTVVSGAFANTPMLQAHRLVYAAIAHLMQGEGAPVHAIDTLRTLTP